MDRGCAQLKKVKDLKLCKKNDEGATGATTMGQAAISWRASGNRQISLNASAERAFANFRDKIQRILPLQIFAT